MIDWLPTVTLILAVIVAATGATWAMRGNISDTSRLLQTGFDAKIDSLKQDVRRELAAQDRKLESFHVEWMSGHRDVATKDDVRRLEIKFDNLYTIMSGFTADIASLKESRRLRRAGYDDP